MEVANLTLGGESLTSIFTTCVDYFQCIRLDRQFGKSYQAAALKLDLIELRLSRWAHAVNDSEDAISVESEAVTTKAEECLGHIIYYFQETEKRASRYKRTMLKSGVDVEAEAEINGHFDEDIESLHQKMKSLTLKHQNRSSFQGKPTWILQEGRYLNLLIEKFNTHVKELVDLFPSAQKQQERFSLEDAEELRDQVAIAALQEANDGEDEPLREAISQVKAG